MTARAIPAEYGAESGRKEEVVRTLGTRDCRTAIRTRDAALDAARRVVNADLADAGMKPLHYGPGLSRSAPAWLSEVLRDLENGLHRFNEREWDKVAQEVLLSDRRA